MSLNQRQNQSRGVFGIVINGVGGRPVVVGGRLDLPCVQVTVKPGEIAAGNLQTQNVPFQENVAGGPEIDGQLVDLAGIQQGGLFLRLAVAGADDALGQVLGEAVGADIDQFGGEIGVNGAGLGEKLEGDRAGDFGVFGERWRGV